MKIIKPSFEILTDLSPEAVLKHIELCGRTCYKSEGRITEDSCRTFIQNIIKRGHEAVLEHFNITVKFICDRGVSHEIVRHRLASYCTEEIDVWQKKTVLLNKFFRRQRQYSTYP